MARQSPCPKCEILQPARTRDQCKEEVYAKLTSYVGSQRLVEETETFSSLGLNTEEQRKFWAEFWIACDIPTTMHPGGTLENILPDSTFPKMPRTVGDFINEVAEERKGVFYWACDDCWVPG